PCTCTTLYGGSSANSRSRTASSPSRPTKRCVVRSVMRSPSRTKATLTAGADYSHWWEWRWWARRPPASLPLDGSGRLARDVEHHPVDLAQLADHACGDLLQEVVRQPRPVGRHRVVGRDGANHDDVAVRALVALDADGADVRKHAERLPQLAIQAGLADLV